MALKDFFKNLSFKAKGEAPFLPLFGKSYGSQIGQTRKYLDEYRNWVFACVQARAEAVGAIELELYKENADGTEEEISKSDLMDLLYKVNPTMTMQDLFMGTQAYLDLDGNAFWFLARDNSGQGKIREIWLLRPDKIDIVINKENPLLVEGYTYKQADGTKIPFDKKEVLHFKNFNPLGDYPFPHRGMGIVQASMWSIDTDNEARLWNYSFFKNSARPDGFISKEGPMAEDDFKRLKEQWNQNYQGSEKAHKVAILSGGLKWENISASQKDMDFLEQRRFARDEILAMFRVPKSVIGIVEDVNRANAEASDYIFASRTVDPLMSKLVATLNEFLVPEFGEDYCLEYESPVPEDRVAKIAEYTAGINKWLTRNEIRDEEGLPPSDKGNEIFGTFADVPIDSVPEETKPVENSYKRINKTKQSVADEMIEQFVSKLPVEKSEEPVKQLSEVAKGNYIEMWKKSFDVETNPLKLKINVFLEDQKQEVIKNIIAETKGLESKEFKFKAISDFMYNEDEAIKASIDFVTPSIARYIKQAGDQASLLVGSGTAFDATTPASIKFLKERAKYFAETFNNTTAKELTAQLTEGVNAGESTVQLSERVAQFYDGIANYRSERAARTEVSAGSNFGAQEAYEQNGVTKMQWLVVNPEDEDCLANEGEVVKIGEAFSSGDVRPPVHPNCVCAVLPYFGK